jgi:hypothetical protein
VKTSEDEAPYQKQQQQGSREDDVPHESIEIRIMDAEGKDSDVEGDGDFRDCDQPSATSGADTCVEREVMETAVQAAQRQADKLLDMPVQMAI